MSGEFWCTPEQSVIKNQACSEHAPSKPVPSPLQMANLHQNELRNLQRKADAEAGCIRQLMIGRYVKHRSTDKLYLVSEVRVGLGWTAMLYGRCKGKKRGTTPIGALHEVEFINPEAS